MSHIYHTEAKIIIVDSNRPLIPPEVIEHSIDISCHGECTVALSPCHDTMFISSNFETVDRQFDRTLLFMGQTPECAMLSDLISVYKYANDHSIEDVTAVLYMACGKTVRAVEGSSKSFKITTKDDLDLFKAIINSERDTHREV